VIDPDPGRNETSNASAFGAYSPGVVGERLEREALAWRAAGWRVESVDQTHGTVLFVRSTDNGPPYNARALVGGIEHMYQRGVVRRLGEGET
jgi:hypothetical protein